MKKFLSSILLASLLISCSSLRMRYDGEFKTGDGRSGKFAYERSYEVKNLRLWCIITGIVYGGACWGYLILPNSDMKQIFNKDAEAKLLELTRAQNVSFDKDAGRFASWDDALEVHQFTLYDRSTSDQSTAQAPAPRPVQPPVQIPPSSTPPTTSSGEFIR